MDEIPHFSVYQRQAHMRCWDSMGSCVRYRQVAVIGSPWVESPVPGKGPGQTLNPPMLRGNPDVDSLECFAMAAPREFAIQIIRGLFDFLIPSRHGGYQIAAVCSMKFPPLLG